MKRDTPIGHCSTVSSHDERFLYLYLSLMIAIFSVVTAMSIAPSRLDDSYLTGQEKRLTSLPLQLFVAHSATIREGTYENLLFLLRSHNVNAILEVAGSRSAPDLAYARALTLQQRLEQHSFTPLDVRVEVLIEATTNHDTTLVLYPYEKHLLPSN